MAAMAMAARRARSSAASVPEAGNLEAPLVDLDVQPLPPCEERLRSSDMQKKVLANDGQQWHRRFVVLTTADVLFARDEAENKVIDYIPLLEIVKVATTKHETMAKNGQQSKKRMSLSEDMGHGDELTFSIMTSEEGHNSGRTYTLKHAIGSGGGGMQDNRIAAKVQAEREVDAWVEAINAGIAAEKARMKRETQGTPLDRVRAKVRKIYESNPVQAFIAAVILASFALNLVNAELLPEDEETIQTFERLDLAFTVIFTIELVVNFFGNYWMPFLRESWNLFDTFVVAISLLSLAMEELPAINMLRLIRIFRVIRLFRALQSLRQIINALIASIFPVISSFLVLLLVTCIYAVLGTMFFREQDPVHFSKFSQSLFTMFQVCTGDSWGSVVSRGNFNDDGDGWDHAIKFFFLSYMLIANMVLTNIVVAVLLDNFIQSVQNEKAEERAKLREIELKKRPRVFGVLDPVLHSLSQFSGPHDLAKRVESLYKFLDIDDNGGLSFEELREGLRKFPTTPHIQLTEEDFDAITEERALCNDEGEMDPVTFEIMMLRQLQSFSLRQLANTMQEIQGDKVPQVSLFIFKMLSLSVEGYFQQRLNQAAEAADHITSQDSPSNLNAGHSKLNLLRVRSSSRKLRALESEGRDSEAAVTAAGNLRASSLHADRPTQSRSASASGQEDAEQEGAAKASREVAARLVQVESRLDGLDSKLDRVLDLLAASASSAAESSHGSHRQRADGRQRLCSLNGADVAGMVLVNPSAEKQESRRGRRRSNGTGSRAAPSHGSEGGQQPLDAFAPTQAGALEWSHPGDDPDDRAHEHAADSRSPSQPRSAFWAPTAQGDAANAGLGHGSLQTNGDNLKWNGRSTAPRTSRPPAESTGTEEADTFVARTLAARSGAVMVRRPTGSRTPTSALSGASAPALFLHAATSNIGDVSPRSTRSKYLRKSAARRAAEEEEREETSGA